MKSYQLGRGREAHETLANGYVVAPLFEVADARGIWAVSRHRETTEASQPKVRNPIP